jgi:antitoxin component YwqK of YwqJK toxin-antitoxin module
VVEFVFDSGVLGEWEVEMNEYEKVVLEKDLKLDEEEDLIVFEGEPFTGIGVESYENGQKKSEKRYKRGVEHGFSYEWYENGKKKSEVPWENGNVNGHVYSWYENGNKNTVGHLTRGDEDDWTSWDEKGEVNRKTRSMGNRRITTLWDKNGKKECEEHYKNQKYDGLFTWWYEDGKLKSQTNWKEEKRHGTQTQSEKTIIFLIFVMFFTLFFPVLIP